MKINPFIPNFSPLSSFGLTEVTENLSWAGTPSSWSCILPLTSKAQHLWSASQARRKLPLAYWSCFASQRKTLLGNCFPHGNSLINDRWCRSMKVPLSCLGGTTLWCILHSRVLMQDQDGTPCFISSPYLACYFHFLTGHHWDHLHDKAFTQDFPS